MKFFFLFFFCSFIFFFDYLAVLISFAFLFCFFVLMSGEDFSGILFFDSFSFVLSFLSLLILFFCYFSNLLDYWVSNFFNSFVFTLMSMFFLIFISFSCFSILLFYFSFEFLFLLMFFFLLGWGYSPERAQASFYMIFYTLVVSFPFLVFIILVGEGFFMNFGLFFEFESYWWLFFLLVFLVKLPVYGAHLWLPKAHVEAPVSGSMLLAGVLLKLGGYGIVRFSNMFLKEMSLFGGYLLSLGLLGGVLSCFLCMRQSDLKAFVAYSSICHMGFALSGLWAGTFVGYEGSLIMFISHGYCSSCLFYMLFVFYERFYSRSMVILKGMGGVLPLMGLIWFFFVAVNMGVPPFFPFYSEIMLFTNLLSKSLGTVLMGGLLLMFAGVYCVFLFILCFHGKGVESSGVSLITMREYVNFFVHSFFLLFSVFFFIFFF